MGAPQADGSAGGVYFFSCAVGILCTAAPLAIPSPGAPHQAAARFGAAVSLSADGAVLAVGAPGERGSAGAVYLYACDPLSVSCGAPLQRLVASRAAPLSLFGASVTLGATAGGVLTMAVGAPGMSLRDVEVNLATPTQAGTPPQTQSLSRTASQTRTWSRSGSTTPSGARSQTVTLSSSASPSASPSATSSASGSPSQSSSASQSASASVAPSGVRAGALYVHLCPGGVCTVQRLVSPPSLDANESFGAVLSASTTGLAIAVGAPSSGGGAGAAWLVLNAWPSESSTATPVSASHVGWTVRCASRGSWMPCPLDALPLGCPAPWMPCP